ncbi:MAG TPA: hypothetical protein VFX28_23845, partial [Methylomirabilota bacterium]|nr:hypothetical protein [Methylomirabilota bacterium]
MSQAPPAHTRPSRELHDVCQAGVELLELAWEGFRTQDREPFRRAPTLPPRGQRGDDSGPEAFVPLHVEQVARGVDAVMAVVGTMIDEGTPFTDRAVREVNSLFERALELLECARDAVMTENRILLRHILERGRQVSLLADDYALAHQQRLEAGVCLPRASTIYLA